MLLYYERSRIGSLCLDLTLDLELSCVLISPWMVLSFLGIDLVDKWTICWIAIICLFVDSSKNPRIGSCVRLKDLVGNLVIKTIKDFDNIVVAWMMLRLTS